MKKIKTSSSFTWICEKENKKFIRKYKRKGLHGYPRTISLRNIDKILKNTEIPHPKLLKNRFNYVEEEFIEKTQELEKDKLINVVIEYIVKMYNINCEKIEKFITWKNNSEYLCFQVKKLKKVLKHRKCKDLEANYAKLENIITKLDDDRKLSLIHGDIHIDNMILNNDKIYLIDWELATYGDIAYELAMHFILMNYDEKTRREFAEQLCKKINVDKDKLLHDIEIYNKFENYRKSILKEMRNS